MHIQRGGTLPRPGIKVEASDLDSGTVVEGAAWKATALRVPHIEPYLTTFAYRFDTEEGSALFLCDAAACPELLELAKGVDTLVTGLVGRNFRSGDASHPVNGVSADISEVVDIAVDGGIPRIVLIHGAPLGDEIVGKLRQGYDGKGYGGLVVRPEEFSTVGV